MPRIALGPFLGLAPKQEPRYLGPAQAQVALNCDLQHGRLGPLNAPGASVGAGNTTLYLDNGTWRTFAADVDVVASPRASATRIYYTGDGVPKVADGATVYPLGLPAPAAPTLSASAKTTSGFTPAWSAWYEEADAARTAVSLGAVTESTVGSVYTVNVPARPPGASAESLFILSFTATDADGVPLGGLIPAPSLSQGHSDLVVGGAMVSGTLATDGATATLTLRYDTSRAADYEVARNYVLTWVRRWPDGQDDEGPPSVPSATVAITPAQNGALTDLPAVPAGYGITHLRVYRAVPGNAETAYLFVTELAGGSSTYTDAKSDAALGEPLPSRGWVAPPASLAGLKAHPGGFLIGFAGKKVYMSEPYQPHAWPEAYEQTSRYPVVGLGLLDNTVAVLTTGWPVLISGDSPDQMVPDTLKLKQACVQKRTIVETGGQVLYASPDGLMSLTAGPPQNLTEHLYSRAQWQALFPAAMRAATHDDQVLVFTFSQTLIGRLTPEGLVLTSTADAVTAAYEDLATDTLYVVIGGQIVPWGTGAARTYRWRSKRFGLERPEAFGALRVLADAYPVTVRLYGDGALRYAGAVAGPEAFWLPTLGKYREWEVELEGTGAVRDVVLAGAMAELTANVLRG